jgi:hypothetical protein
MGWEVPYLGNFEAWRGFLKGRGIITFALCTGILELPFLISA